MGRVSSLVAALVVLVGCTYPGSLPTTTPATAGTTVTTGLSGVSTPTVVGGTDDEPGAASQSPEDAARDGVVSELAEASFDERVGVRVSVETEEGTWVLSYPPDGGLTCPSSEAGVYGVDWVCAWEYSEILLLGDDGRILRAYPMPGLPASWLHVDGNAVYTGRVGDGGIPDSSLARINRETFALSGWVFPFGVGGPSEVTEAINAGEWLDGWNVLNKGAPAYLSSSENTVDGIQAESWIGPIYVNMDLVREFFATHAGCDVASSVSGVLEGDEQVAVVFYQCGPGSSFPVIDTRVERIVSADMTPLEATLRALLSGPTPTERDAGFVSFFNNSTADALKSVTVDGTRAFVDFNFLILVNNASTSTGGMFFMAELRANVFQFDEIDSVVWSVNGDCEAFGNWLQVGECMTDTREAWEQMLTAWGER